MIKYFRYNKKNNKIIERKNFFDNIIENPNGEFLTIHSGWVGYNSKIDIEIWYDEKTYDKEYCEVNNYVYKLIKKDIDFSRLEKLERILNEK